MPELPLRASIGCMACYAVGDIQGCYAQLRELLRQADVHPGRDRLWCVGDLVNRGPDSLSVLRYLADLGDRCTVVLGNHDLYLLYRAAGGAAKNDTLDSVLEAEDAPRLIDWLRSRPLFFRDASLGWSMVHAGLSPCWMRAQAEEHARGLERRLKSDDWRAFVRGLFGTPAPDAEPSPEDPAWFAFSAAVLTRTRYCTADGRFDWSVRSGTSRDPEQRPWYAHPDAAWRQDAGTVVFGHWAARGLVTDEAGVLGLDSGCVWGGKLTLAELLPGGGWRIAAQVDCPACAPIGA